MFTPGFLTSGVPVSAFVTFAADPYESVDPESMLIRGQDIYLFGTIQCGTYEAQIINLDTNAVTTSNLGVGSLGGPNDCGIPQQAFLANNLIYAYSYDPIDDYNILREVAPNSLDHSFLGTANGFSYNYGSLHSSDNIVSGQYVSDFGIPGFLYLNISVFPNIGIFKANLSTLTLTFIGGVEEKPCVGVMVGARIFYFPINITPTSYDIYVLDTTTDIITAMDFGVDMGSTILRPGLESTGYRSAVFANGKIYAFTENNQDCLVVNPSTMTAVRTNFGVSPRSPDPTRLTRGLNSGDVLTDFTAINNRLGSTICAVGLNGRAVISTDEGRTFTGLPQGLNSGNVNANFRGVDVNSFDDVIMVVGDDGYAARSIDGGATFVAMTRGLNSGNVNANFKAITHINNDSWIAVGDGGVAVRTINAGVTWTPLPQGLNTGSTTADFTGIARYFYSTSSIGVIVVARDGYAARSLNAGSTFVALPRGLGSGNTNANFTSVYAFTDDMPAYAVAEDGWAARASDPGATFAAIPRGLNTGLTAANFTGVHAGDTTAIFVAADGYASFTSDGGLTFQPLERGLNSGLEGANFTAVGDSNGGDGYLVVSSEGYASLINLANPPTYGTHALVGNDGFIYVAGRYNRSFLRIDTTSDTATNIDFGDPARLQQCIFWSAAKASDGKLCFAYVTDPDENNRRFVIIQT